MASSIPSEQLAPSTCSSHRRRPRLLAICVHHRVDLGRARAWCSQLAKLRQRAGTAHQRLPQVMARLAPGKRLTSTAEAPPWPPARRDRAGQAGFTSVQRSAIEAAVARARLRARVTRPSGTWPGVVIAAAPAAPSSTTWSAATSRGSSRGCSGRFHLTTRMRRHAEGLVVSSGRPAGAQAGPTPCRCGRAARCGGRSRGLQRDPGRLHAAGRRCQVRRRGVPST